MKIIDQYNGELILQDYRKARKRTTTIKIHEVVPKMGTTSAKFLATKPQVIKIVQELMRLFYIGTEELVVEPKRMTCFKYGAFGCEMNVSTCLAKQQIANGKGGFGQGNVDPGCKNCEQGKEVACG